MVVLALTLLIYLLDPASYFNVHLLWWFFWLFIYLFMMFRYMLLVKYISVALLLLLYCYRSPALSYIFYAVVFQHLLKLCFIVHFQYFCCCCLLLLYLVSFCCSTFTCTFGVNVSAAIILLHGIAIWTLSKLGDMMALWLILCLRLLLLLGLSVSTFKSYAVINLLKYCAIALVRWSFDVCSVAIFTKMKKYYFDTLYLLMPR